MEPKFEPRRVRIGCPHCGEFNTTQRHKNFGCPQCGSDIKILQDLTPPETGEPERKFND